MVIEPPEAPIDGMNLKELKEGQIILINIRSKVCFFSLEDKLYHNCSSLHDL